MHMLDDEHDRYHAYFLCMEKGRDIVLQELSTSN